MVRVTVARCRVVAPRERWEVRPELRVIASEHANSTWGKAQYRKKNPSLYPDVMVAY